MKWGWTQTLMLLVASLVLTYIIYLATGIFLFILLFIPPAVHYFKRK
jgi:hypothetical protein